jgi:carboxyl-terminal processing protease
MKRTAGIIFRTLLLILIGVTIGMLISDSNIGGHRLGLNFSGPDKISRMLRPGKHQVRRFGKHRQRCRRNR